VTVVPTAAKHYEHSLLENGEVISAPVLVNGTIYHVSRSDETFVYATGPKFKLLAQNRFVSDKGAFSATPAISDGQLFIRSSNYLYCVTAWP
jgi:outer membrane protein assembly factor BamB